MKQVNIADHLRIRRAHPTDAAEVARIYNIHVSAGGVTFDVDPWGESETAARIGQPDPDGWFIAEDDGVALGWASVRRFSERLGYRYTCESAIYLDPAAYGRGVADALQQRLEVHCVRCRIHHAVARIVSDNSRSIAFHRRYGYQIVGVQNEVGHIEDRWIDVTIMQKIFRDLPSGA